MLGAESLPPQALAARSPTAPHTASFTNCYGPTESTVGRHCLHGSARTSQPVTADRGPRQGLTSWGKRRSGPAPIGACPGERHTWPAANLARGGYHHTARPAAGERWVGQPVRSIDTRPGKKVFGGSGCNGHRRPRPVGPEDGRKARLNSAARPADSRSTGTASESPAKIEDPALRGAPGDRRRGCQRPQERLVAYLGRARTVPSPAETWRWVTSGGRLAGLSWCRRAFVVARQSLAATSSGKRTDARCRTRLRATTASTRRAIRSETRWPAIWARRARGLPEGWESQDKPSSNSAGTRFLSIQISPAPARQGNGAETRGTLFSCPKDRRAGWAGRRHARRTTHGPRRSVGTGPAAAHPDPALVFEHLRAHSELSRCALLLNCHRTWTTGRAEKPPH